MKLIAVIVTTFALSGPGQPEKVKSEKIYPSKVDASVSCSPDYIAGMKAALNLGKNANKIRVDVDCKEMK